MRLSWLRLIVSIFVLLAALASVQSWAKETTQACAGMTMEDPCPDHQSHGQAPRHCDLFVCGALQLPVSDLAILAPIITVDQTSITPDDARLIGFNGPPDLRPPIIWLLSR